MKKTLIMLLSLTMMLWASGCGEKEDSSATMIPGTWQTASIGYMDGDDMQPEYYVQFTDVEVNYGHMKDGAFVLDHSDKISTIEKGAAGDWKVQAESASGVKYTYHTAEGDADVLEYYETWNEDDFSKMYRGGASLIKTSDDKIAIIP